MEGGGTQNNYGGQGWKMERRRYGGRRDNQKVPKEGENNQKKVK